MNLMYALEIEKLIEETQLFQHSHPYYTLAILLVVAFLFSVGLGWLCFKTVCKLILRLVGKTKTVLDDYLLTEDILKKACGILSAIVFFLLFPYCFEWTDLSKNILAFNVLDKVSRIYLTISFCFLISAFLNNVQSLTKEEESYRRHHILGILQFAKLLVYCIGGIVILGIVLNKSPLSLIAGLGAVATILMLVFKDSILGLVAGIQLSYNKMLKPGDWISIKKHDIEGFVQSVSLTTVKIRNFDNTISTVPPYLLVSESFKNWSSMLRFGSRRVKRCIYVDISTIRMLDADEVKRLRGKSLIGEDQQMTEGFVNLTLFRNYVEDYLTNISQVEKQKWLMVRQLDGTPHGLPIEIYFYSKETRFVEYEHFAAERMEHILAVMPEFSLKAYQYAGFAVK